MSRIEIKDYIQNVELNRQRLVNATGIDKNSSLSMAVTETLKNIQSDNSVKINPIVDESGRFRVRFFDIDGTLLKQEYVEPGASIIPPANPSYESDILTFDRWASAVGDKFTDIQSPLDYAPLYYPTKLCNYYRIDLRKYPIKDITVSTYTYSYTYNSKTYNILCVDWGDNSELSTTTAIGENVKLSHTYENPGEYLIRVFRARLDTDTNTYIDSYTDGEDLQSFLNHAFYMTLSGSWGSGYTLGSESADRCLVGAYAIKCSMIRGWPKTADISVIYNTASSSSGNNWNIGSARFPVFILHPVGSWSDYFTLELPRGICIIDFQDVINIGSNTYLGIAYNNNRAIQGTVADDLINDLVVYPENCPLVMTEGLSSYYYGKIWFTNWLLGTSDVNYLASNNNTFSYSPTHIISPNRKLPCWYANSANQLRSSSGGLITPYEYKKVILPSNNNILRYWPYMFSYTDIISWEMPNNIVYFNSNAFSDAHKLQELWLTDDWDYDISIRNTSLNKISLINLSSKLLDRSGTTAKILTLDCNIYKKLNTIRVKLINNVLIESSDTDAVSLVDLISNKNWTMSIFIN